MIKSRRKQDPTTPQREPFTYIHHDTIVNGELVGSGRVRIHGTVRGNVRVNGVLEVAEAGLVEGAWIVADEVKIIGRVQVESLTAHGKVEIWRGGELIGDVKASSLDIEEGARFTGRSEMAVPPGAVGDGHRGAQQSLPATEPEQRPRTGDSGHQSPAAVPEHQPRVANAEQPQAAKAEQPASAALELLGHSDDATF